VVIKTATRTPGPGGSTQFGVEHGGGTQAVTTTGGGFTDLAFGPEVGALGLTTDGSGGSATIDVPSALLGGDLVVQADGTVLTATRTSTAAGSRLAFDVPPGTHVVTVTGTAVGEGGPPPPAGGGDFPWLLVVAGAAAAAAAVAAVVVWRKRQGP
jgi:hypothetical protein